MAKVIGELLAPAGNLESAIAALENGADAVYAGFSKFNAREMNENFSLKDMSKLSAYCKSHNKRFYNTFNTLVKEDELEEFYQTISYAIDLEADAFIVQDIGVATLIKKLFPSQKIHTSTQMGIHNSLGLQWAKENGFERVILERQITYKELQILAQKKLIELEIFIHGALCCSISGSCIFSSWIGGYSGNRGKCKQPCRRRYFDHTKKNKNGFYFSTTDLCTIDMMKKFLDLEINSFKIEGRLKRLDYILATVKAYRKVIDEAFNENEKLSIGNAKQILSSAPSRVWSHGFFDKENYENVVTPLRLGVAGKLAGEIVSIQNNAITIKATTLLKRGDRIRFQGVDSEQAPSITLYKFNNLTNKMSKTIKPNDVAIIYTNTTVSKECRLYLVGNSITYPTHLLENLPEFKKIKEFNLTIDILPSLLKITAIYKQSIFSKTFSCNLEIAHNKNQDMNSNIIKIFSQTAHNEYRLATININSGDNYFISASFLKEIRRNFYSDFFKEIELLSIEENSSLPTNKQIISNLKESLIQSVKTKIKQTEFDTIKKIIAIDKKRLDEIKEAYPDAQYAIDITQVSHNLLNKQLSWICPPFLPESQLTKLINQIEGLIKKGEKNFIITALYQLPLFEALKSKYEDSCKKLCLTSIYPLQTNNSLSALTLLEKLDRTTLWIELSKKEQEDIIASIPTDIAKRLLQYKEGYPALLTTRAKLIESNDIKDNHGLPFKIIKKDYFSETLYQLYSQKKFLSPQTITDENPLFYDFREGEQDNMLTDQFNFNYKWV